MEMETDSAILLAEVEDRLKQIPAVDCPGTQQVYSSRDFSQVVIKARNDKLDPVIGRDEEIRRVIQILSRRTKNNPILIGEPGVGKTAIVEGLAIRIIRGDVPEGLKERRLIVLDMGSLIAGAKFRREFEEHSHCGSTWQCQQEH